jgi:hypothetical protein
MTTLSTLILVGKLFECQMPLFSCDISLQTLSYTCPKKVSQMVNTYSESPYLVVIYIYPQNLIVYGRLYTSSIILRSTPTLTPTYTYYTFLPQNKTSHTTAPSHPQQNQQTNRSNDDPTGRPKAPYIWQPAGHP